MPPTLSYPGVYVAELDSGVRTITGVGTSIAAFVGRAFKGELYKPVQCLSYEDFKRAFTDVHVGSDLGRAVRLFFQNGGTQCYVSRIADEKAAAPQIETASVDVANEAGAPTLRFAARSPGAFGNDVRFAVTYNTEEPEATFNLEVFRWVKNSSGGNVKADVELYVALTMNPASPRFAVKILDQHSKLVKATDLGVAASANGFSQGGRTLAAKNATTLRKEVMALLKKTSAQTHFQFMVSVDGGPAQLIDLGVLDFTVAPLVNVAGFEGNLETEIENLINPKIAPATVSVDLLTGPSASGAVNNSATRLLRISSANGDVRITAGFASSDVTRILMLGTAQGGTEVSKWANRRPAPNGIVFQPTFATGTNINSFANRLQAGGLPAITIGGVTIPIATLMETTPAAVPGPDTAVVQPRFFQDADSLEPAVEPYPASDGVREKWAIIASEIRKTRVNDPNFPWIAEVWGSRLAILAADGSDNLTATVTASGGLGGDFNQGTRLYSLGNTGLGPFQSGGVAGINSGKPTLADYDEAYLAIDREVDLFNLLVLPRDWDDGDVIGRQIWGPASIFCRNRRAFLLMDPPPEWTDSQKATDPTVGVATLRTGLVKDYAAIFYPNVLVSENGMNIPVGPSGAIAGLMARIDSSRGVWKAPAGTEADLRGVTGLERRFTDGENGVMNPHAINTIRVFPNGIVNWGARTMHGDDADPHDYKYIPIRRLALYIEESLYRGLKWVVFEPNDEPLWAQIRLNVGAFMNNLYRQGAFQGQMPKDAYFVKCDASTTTQNDRNLGTVNIAVGFAPLKPAEFVVLTLQQMAGQIQV